MIDLFLAQVKDAGFSVAVAAVVAFVLWKICTEAVGLAVRRLFETGPALFEVLKWTPAWGGALFFALQTLISVSPELAWICLDTGQAADFFPACSGEHRAPLIVVGYATAALALASIASLYGRIHAHLADVIGKILVVLAAGGILAAIAVGSLFAWKSKDPSADFIALVQDARRRLSGA